MAGFNSPTTEDVEKKGYKLKQQEPEWKVLHHLEEGLTEYIGYKVRSGAGQTEDYEGCKDLIKKKVMWQVDKEVHTLPQGTQGKQKVKDMKKEFAFLKEDTGPHNWVGVCKRLYKHRRDIYLQSDGFEVLVGHSTTPVRPPRGEGSRSQQKVAVHIRNMEGPKRKHTMD